MLKIAIEAQRIFRKNKHGMDFVALEMIRHLQQIDSVNEYYVLVAPGDDPCLAASEHLHLIFVSCPTYPLWEQVALPAAIRKIKPDVLHCTSNTAPLFCKVPLILTLHDIIYLEPRQQSSGSLYQNMGWYYRKLVVPRILSKCKKIITVSHFEKNRIKETLNLEESVLVAIYNGVGDHFKPVEHPETTTLKYVSDTHYILFLGNTDPKKNTAGTLTAYGYYVQQTTNPLPLVVADLNESYIDQTLHEIGMPFLKAYIRHTGYIPNNDLPAIYSGATVFLYPSLRESFGIPLLEAMACGTPVITSNTSSMPEVAGEAALLADPFNSHDMAEKLTTLLSDKSLYHDLVQKGFKRAIGFSWLQTAKNVLKLYQEVTNYNA